MMNEQSYQEWYPPVTEEQARKAMREREALIRMWEAALARAKAHRDKAIAEAGYSTVECGHTVDIMTDSYPAFKTTWIRGEWHNVTRDKP